MRPLACRRLSVLTGHAKELLGDGFDLVLVEVVLFDQTEDELLLLVRTDPDVTGIGRGLRCVVGRLLPIAVGRRGVFHAVGDAIGQKADGLDFLIHALLEQVVEAGTFLLDLGEVGEFGADADDVGMTAEVGQPQLFAVGGFEDDGHKVDGSFLCGWWDVGTKNPALGGSRMNVRWMCGEGIVSV